MESGEGWWVMGDKSEYSFERLAAWQDGMTLTHTIYDVTKDSPKDEWFGIVSQIRRAAVSIPVNIAEGRGRFHKKEQVQFFYNARGSLYEVLTLLKLSRQLNYLNQNRYDEIEQLCRQLISKLSGLINSLKESRALPSSPFTLHPSPTP